MKKALGVLGGMGPQATADFLQKVISLTEASKEADHIRIYADINPQVPDRTSGILEGGESPAPVLIEGLKKLEAQGAERIVMPCITAHYYYNELNAHVSRDKGVEFINLPEITALACVNNYPKKTAGIISTYATRKSGVLKNKFDAKNVPYVELSAEHQEIMMKLIYGVKTGANMDEIVEQFKAVVAGMLEKGAEYFVLGCTETPLIAGAYDFPYDIVDPTVELAKAAVLSCGGKLKR